MWVRLPHKGRGSFDARENSCPEQLRGVGQSVPPQISPLLVLTAAVCLLADEAEFELEELPAKAAKGSQPGRQQVKPRYLSNGNWQGLRRHEWFHQRADDNDFRRALRVSRATYAFVKQRLQEKGYYDEPRKRARHDSLSIDERISIALARMGTQAENESLGDSGRSADTVSKTLDHFASAWLPGCC